MELTGREDDRRQEQTAEELGVADGVSLSINPHISSPVQLPPCCERCRNLRRLGIGTSPPTMVSAPSEADSYGERFPGILPPWLLRLSQKSALNRLRLGHDSSGMEPQFYTFQLVGDGLLLRFAEQIMSKECKSGNGLLYLGLCVHGQTIEELWRRVQANFAILGKKVILLVGTNDLLQGKDMEEMILSYDNLVDTLEQSVEKLVILTLPPIPKLEDNILFKQKFNYFNTILKLYPRKYPNISNIDITSFFETAEKSCNMEYFERWPDLVHFNYAGFSLLQDILLKSHALYD